MRFRHRAAAFFGATFAVRALTDFIGLGGLRLGFGMKEKSVLACLSASLSLVIASTSSIGGSLLMLEVEISATLLPGE